jgi:hypothetical protein
MADFRALRAMPKSLRQTATGFVAGAVGGGLLLAMLHGSAVHTLMEESGLPWTIWSAVTLPIAFLVVGVGSALLVARLGRNGSSEGHDIR